MGFAETANLVARLSLKDDFSKPLTGAQKKLKGFGSSLKSLGKGVGVGVGAAVGVAATFVTSQVRSGLDNLALLEDATTSVDGAIKQLGLTGKVTSGQIAGWANEIEANTQAAFDDKDITAAATTLLRYGKVAPAALKETLTVMTDLAAKTGSVDSAASKLAKSLADPTKASRILREVGVTLTEEQQKLIKLWVKEGKLGKAQALILKEVAKQTKGAAAAMNGPYRDSQKVFADVTEDAQKALATGFLPILEEVRRELSTELAKPETLARIKDFGTTLAGGFKGLVTSLKGLPWNEIGAAVGSVVDFGKNLGKGFLDLPADVKAVLLGLFALNKVSGGAVVKISADLVSTGLGALFGQFLGKGSVANPMFVVPVGGGLGGGAAPVVAGGAASGALGLVSKVFIVGGLASIADEIQTALGSNYDPTKDLPLDQLSWPWGPKNTPKLDIGSFKNVLGGDSSLTSSGKAFEPVIRPIDLLTAEIREQNRLTKAGGAKPLTPKQQQAFDKVRNDAEANRIKVTTGQKTPNQLGMVFKPSATVQVEDRRAQGMFDRVRNSAEANRIALVSSQKTGDAAIIAAIHNNRPIVTVNVTANITAGSVARARITKSTYSAGHVGALKGM